jgi:hypothetical protein
MRAGALPGVSGETAQPLMQTQEENRFDAVPIKLGKDLDENDHQEHRHASDPQPLFGKPS